MRRLTIPALLLLCVACSGSPDDRKASGGEKPNEETPAVLAAPQGLTAIGVEKAVNLTWNAVAGATGYVVSKASKAGGPYTDLAKPSVTSHEETGLTPGDTFYYVVRAVNDTEVSANSTEVFATVRYPTAAAPVTVAAVAGDGHVRLYWGAGARAVLYQVSRGATVVYTGTALSFTDNGLPNGTEYTYTVASLNEDDVATPAAPVKATPYAWGRLLCVTGGMNNAIYTFPADVSGAPVPVRTISGPSPMTAPSHIALDAARQTILVRDSATNEILTFSTGNQIYAQPLRRLRGSWSSPKAITVDTMNAELYVLDTGGNLYVYPVTDSGVGTIARQVTVQTDALAIALDPAHGEVFTAGSSTVKAWNRTTLAQIRQYTGSFNNGMRGLAYAPTLDRLAVVESTYITYYSRMGAGAGSSSWGAANWQSVAYSGSARDAWIVTRKGYAGSVQVYRKPVNFSSDSTLLLAPPVTWSTVAADGANDSFWLISGDTIKSFSQAMDTTSIRAWSPVDALGTTNGINLPAGLASDPDTQELFVLNEGSGTLTVYSWSASGSANPSRTVQVTNGPALSGPFTLASGQDAVFAVAGAGSVVKFSSTANGTVDWTTAPRSNELLDAMLGLTYDAARGRLAGHMRMTTGIGAFGFWPLTLGDAIESFADPYFYTYPHAMVMTGDRMHYATDVVYHFNYFPGSSVNFTGPSTFFNGPPLGRSALLIDERNNELLYAMGGQVYTLPKDPPNGWMSPRRILDVTNYTGVNVNGLAFCSQ